jgi:hypothetical protein
MKLFNGMIFASIFALSLSACGGGGGNSGGNSNQAPTVSAGPDITADENQLVSLTASGSDPDGQISSYSWSQISERLIGQAY